MKRNVNGMMKKNYVLAIGAALLMLASCNAPKRYGCNNRRCIVMTNTIEQAAHTQAVLHHTKDA